MAVKLSVSGIMELVTDMATDVKRSMRPNTFGMPFLLFSFSLTIFLRLNPKMRKFECSGIRREDYEGTSCSYPLGESSVAASRLTSVGFFTPL